MMIINWKFILQMQTNGNGRTSAIPVPPRSILLKHSQHQYGIRSDHELSSPPPPPPLPSTFMQNNIGLYPLHYRDRESVIHGERERERQLKAHGQEAAIGFYTPNEIYQIQQK